MLRSIPNRWISAVAILSTLAVTMVATVHSGKAAVITPAGPTPSVPQDVEQSFAIFRDVPATPMPANVADVVAAPTKFGRNPALARQINTTNGAGWVVPGADHVCVVVPDPVDGYGTVCTPNAWARDNGVVLEMRRARSGGDVSVTMLVPDGSDVISTDAGGTRSVGHDMGVISRVVHPGEALELKRP